MGCEDHQKQALHKNKGDSDSKTSMVNSTPPAISDTTLLFDSGDLDVSVRIKMPKNKYRGTLLVLQGWNFPNTSWSDSSDLENRASEEGFALVMPDMGKSIYHKKVYEQTRKDWRKYPTRTWLVDTMLQKLNQDFGLFPKDGYNFVMGLSTGGRGAFIIAQENPDIFTAGASLSGDYDQDAFPEDNLYRGYFGTKPERWNKEENPVNFVDKWSVPMYFAHGAADSIVSVAHQNRLKSLFEQLKLDQDWYFYVAEGYGHNYQFWSKEVDGILDFFSSFIKPD